MLALILTAMLVTDPQQPSVEMTRAEEVRQVRQEKAQHLEAPKRGFLENGLHEFKERRIMERFEEGLFGFHPLVGGMRAGAGFGLGASYSKGNVTVSGQRSLKGYEKYEASLTVPGLPSDKLFATVRAGYRNFTQENFYGVGNDSRIEDRANYRLEDRTLNSEFGLQITPHAKVGGTVGWIETRISEGTSSHLPSLRDAAVASNLHGLDNAPSYLQTGAFLDIDYRDQPGNPRSGARYLAKWSSFRDQDLGAFGFNRYDVEIQQYFPFFNQRRVIALRAKTTLTQTADGREVPFYMLPSLGGSQEVRGYSEFRFRDRNVAVFNAEYRWEAFSGLDLALFADAGQVASHVRDFALSEMKTAGGIGFRFNTSKKVFARVDLGFSQEGPRVFVNFGHVF